MCLICERIQAIKEGRNPYFVAETTTGYVVLGDHQFFRGYTLLLSKVHAEELHELPLEMRNAFLAEMADVAAAVYRAFKPVKLNYELLGNKDRHLHWHLFPRHADDPRPQGPVSLIDGALRRQEPSAELLDELKGRLRKELTPHTAGS